MAVDLITLAMAKKYTNKVASGMGAIKGAPCTIDSITEVDGNYLITFKWSNADGTEETSSITIENGKQGLSAYDVAVAEGYSGTKEEWLKSLQGESPTIGNDGNWYIGDSNTGVSAQASNPTWVEF